MFDKLCGRFQQGTEEQECWREFFKLWSLDIRGLQNIVSRLESIQHKIDDVKLILREYTEWIWHGGLG